EDAEEVAAWPNLSFPSGYVASPLELRSAFGLSGHIQPGGSHDLDIPRPADDHGTSRISPGVSVRGRPALGARAVRRTLWMEGVSGLPAARRRHDQIPGRPAYGTARGDKAARRADPVLSEFVGHGHAAGSLVRDLPDGLRGNQ